MAEKISAYRANDGKVFDTFKEAQNHDLTLLRNASVTAFLESIGATGEQIVNAEGEPVISLGAFLLAHHEALAAALNVKPKSWSRKPKAPKASTGAQA